MLRETQCPPIHRHLPIASSLIFTTLRVPFARYGFSTTSFGFVPCSVDMKSTNLWTCLRARIKPNPRYECWYNTWLRPPNCRSYLCFELHIRGREHRLERDLRTSATEVEGGVRRCIRRRRSLDGPQEVIRRDPCVHALILPVHNHDPSFLLSRKGEERIFPFIAFKI